MKKVLINWYYHRFDLTAYLLKFTDEMEIVFLFKQFPSEEPDYILNQKNVSIIYWGDYHSPQQLLREIKPDVVVFADIESFNQIALNIAARNKGIRTFVLQHGLRGAFEVEEALSIKGNFKDDYLLSNTSFWSLRFFINSLSLKNIFSFPQLIRFMWARKKGELTSVLYHHQFELRKADFYIEFSEENTGYHKLRDGIPANRFIIVGNPLFDEFFEYLNHENNLEQSAYCLLIDCPFTEANFLQDHGITLAKKNVYLKKLSEWTQNNGYQLKVKLHPLSYHLKNLYQNKNIEYLKEANIKEVISKATVVFFLHYTSVAPIILAYKPCIYFHSNLKEHTEIFKNLGVPVMNLFEFEDQKTDIISEAKKVELQKLIPYLFNNDGKAIQRIKDVLLLKTLL